MTEQPSTKDEARSSRAAMIAAVEIGLLVAMGGHGTGAYGKKIQEAIDASTPDASLLRELVEALEKYREGMAMIGTCGDGNCVIVKPKGQHTNGGCHCYRNETTARRAMARGSYLAAAIDTALSRARKDLGT